MTAAALDFTARLNSAQLAAVTYEGGPLLVVAGAGSGKTRTLVHRVAYLVDQGVHPASILLLTFTRKAASEMLGRASALVGGRAAQVSGGTFHSLANHLLRTQAHLLGFPAGFGIMDQDDAETLLARLLAEASEAKRHKRFPRKGAILNVISRMVNKDQPLLQVLSDDFPHFLEFAPALERLSREYREHKVQNALMDFDDLLVGLERILAEHEQVRRNIASRYEYILVDEYQDTNPLQARLTHLLGRDHLRVTAVGDDAQSIYAFRGASFRNIMDFPKIFPGTKILKLEENYRSKKPILALANQLIAQAGEKYDKQLKAFRGDGPPPQMVAVSDQREEALWVADRIEELLKEYPALEDIAVLFRAASHSFDLEVELTRRKLPYTKYGGRKFLESAHIKDFLAFLRVAANPADSLSLRRVLMMTPGLGPKGADEVAAWVGGQRDRLINLAGAPVREAVRKKMSTLLELMARIAQPGEELLFRLQAISEYYGILIRDLYPNDWPDRQGDIRELRQMAGTQTNLAGFLADMTLDPPNQTRMGPENRGRGLTLSTVHSAKGLEWKAVFILSAVEGRFPPSYGTRTPAEVDEERRLMYVAVTRAEDLLYIMMPLGLVDRRTGLSAQPSRFLAAASPGGGTPNRSIMDLGRYSGTDDGVGFEPPSLNIGQKAAPARPGRLPIQPLLEAALGQRVVHPVYGSGLVTDLKGPQAVIDFDYFGKKTITLKYARLSTS